MNVTYGRGMRHSGKLAREYAAFAMASMQFDDYIEFAFVTLAPNEPANFKEAMKSNDAPLWKVSGISLF